MPVDATTLDTLSSYIHAFVEYPPVLFKRRIESDFVPAFEASFFMEFHAPVMPSAILNVVTPPRESEPPFKLNRHRLGFESPDPFADKEPPITTSGFASDASMSSFIVELSIFIFEAFIWIVELLAADISPAIEILFKAESQLLSMTFFTPPRRRVPTDWVESAPA